jgi:hypothetical protein
MSHWQRWLDTHPNISQVGCFTLAMLIVAMVGMVISWLGGQ